MKAVNFRSDEATRRVFDGGVILEAGVSPDTVTIQHEYNSTASCLEVAVSWGIDGTEIARVVVPVDEHGFAPYWRMKAALEALAAAIKSCVEKREKVETKYVFVR